MGAGCGQNSPRSAGPHSLAGPLAQLVEQGTFNPKVVGSSPTRPTSNTLFRPGRLRRGRRRLPLPARRGVARRRRPRSCPAAGLRPAPRPGSESVAARTTAHNWPAGQNHLRTRVPRDGCGVQARRYSPSVSGPEAAPAAAPLTPSKARCRHHLNGHAGLRDTQNRVGAGALEARRAGGGEKETRRP
jgi:hypothetical protein